MSLGTGLERANQNHIWFLLWYLGVCYCTHLERPVHEIINESEDISAQRHPAQGEGLSHQGWPQPWESLGKTDSTVPQLGDWAQGACSWDSCQQLGVKVNLCAISQQPLPRQTAAAYFCYQYLSLVQVAEDNVLNWKAFSLPVTRGGGERAK